MALLPTRQRDQIMLGLVIASLGLGYAFFTYLWQPKDEELTATQARVDSLVVMNQRAKSELAQGKTQEIKAEAQRYAADLDVMRRLVPTGNEVPALLEQVSTAARRVGLDIADVQPLPLLTGDQYDAYKYRLSVRGSFHEIAVLLGNVGSLQRIVAPINLTLAPISLGVNGRKQAKMQPIEARFEIQTYVVRTAPPAPPAPPRTARPAKAAGEPAESGEKL
jgi:type IV pilus assembly protein PilO